MEKTTSYNPQQGKDAGLWMELLLTARQGTTNKSFFVVDVVGSCLHTAIFCKLELPTAFLDHHIRSLREKLTLQDSGGHRWPAMLGMTLDSKICIIQGWQEVAADYNLEVKDQVVFFLLNDSHFMIQVFDGENNVKLRVLPSTDREGQSNRDFSKARSNQLTRELAEKANMDVQAPAHEEGASSPVNEDISCQSATKVESIRQLMKVNHDSADLPLLQHSPPDGNEVLQIPVSSEDEEQVPLQHINLDGVVKVTAMSPVVTNISKVRPEKNLTRCNSEVTKVDAEDRIETIPEDKGAQMHVLSREPAEMELQKTSRKESDVDDNDDDEDVVRNERNCNIMKNLKGNQTTRRGSAVLNEPSGSGPVSTRSRKLQRNTEECKDDDLYTPSTVRKLECEEQMSNGEKTDYERSRKKLLTRRRSIRVREMLEMPKVGAAIEPSSNLDLGTREALLKENVESKVIQPAAPRTLRELRSKTLANSRSNVKVFKDRGEKKAANADPPEDVVKPVCKRPKPMKNGGMAASKELPILYKSKRRPITDEERQQALITAQEYANMSKSKHYVMQLKKTQVYCGFHLGVPKEMVDALQLPLRTMDVMLCDASGRKWQAEWMGAHPKHPGINSKGWTRFVLEHYLEEGDCCVFELSDSRVFNISVQIFPVVSLFDSSENGWRDHYTFEQKEMGPPLARSLVRNPTFHAQASANST